MVSEKHFLRIVLKLAAKLRVADELSEFIHPRWSEDAKQNLVLQFLIIVCNQLSGASNVNDVSERRV
jgi:hypothetical protein